MAPVPETHAFLFEPGVWRARGSFGEADGTLVDAWDMVLEREA